MTAGRRLGSLAAALLVASAACGGTGRSATPVPGHPEARAVRSEGTPAGQPNSIFFYDGAMFGTECTWSHSAHDDPIVLPGRPGASHLHDFFGNPSTDARSTAASLRARGDSTCDIRQDTAAYWAPALLRGVTPVRPMFADVYYRVAPGVEARSVRPYPEGLAMVARGAHARGPIDPEIAGWGCGYGPNVTSSIPDCAPATPLTLRVTFPDCWNGRDLNPPDHVSHVAYSGPRGCPRGYPVAFPQLTLMVDYPVSGDPTGLHPSSGAPYTAHADFLNVWDPATLRSNIDACLHRDVVCSVPRAGRR